MKFLLTGSIGIFAGSSLLQAQESLKHSFELSAELTGSVGSTRKIRNKPAGMLVAAPVISSGTVFGVMVNLGLDYLTVNTAILNILGTPNGNIDLFTGLINPVYHLPAIDGASFYVSGGGGYSASRITSMHQTPDLRAVINFWVLGVSTTLPAVLRPNCQQLLGR